MMNRSTAAMGALFIMAHVCGAAGPAFTLSFTTADYGSNPNILAGYVMQGSTYINTIGVYTRNNYISKLTSWRAASGISSYLAVDADAYMGATRPNFSTPNPVVFVWDFKDKNNADVPDGTYTVNLEMVNENQGHRFTSFTFLKDGNYGTRSVPNNYPFTGISIVYPNLNPDPDSDNDGMLDSWEIANGLIVGVNDADSDKDGDGSSNYTEYVAGTEANNAASVFRLDSTSTVDAASGTAMLHWNSVNGKLYRIETTHNLSEVWEPVTGAGGIAATPPMNSWTGSIKGNIAFYRVAVALPDDSDGDWMPDTWESDNGLNPDLHDAELDKDGDGSSNYSEYVAGTDPDSAASVFKMSPASVDPPAGTITLRWSSVEGKLYRIQRTDSLSGDWISLTGATGIAATPPENSWTVSLGAENILFYRVVVEP